MTETLPSLLHLLQMSDSAIPIGGYSHSWGLETWVQLDELKSAADVEQALRVMLKFSIAPTDGVACSLAHRFAGDDDESSFLLLNKYLTAGRWSREPLEASLSMGQRLKQLAMNIGWVRNLPSIRPHHCAAFGWLAGAVKIPRGQAVAAYLHSSMASHVSACVRLIPLGHTDGQLILSRLIADIDNVVPSILDAGLDELGGFALMNEWACKQHESLYSRLFQS